MKRFLKGFIPLVLIIGILLSIGWYLFVYDREFTRDMLISQARHLDARGNTDLAAKLYDMAYDYTGKDEDVAIELANQYKHSGNYTKAESTLTNAIANGGTVDLYIALSKTYVEQDKLQDAVAMLDNISDPVLKAEMDRLRPAAPQTNPAPGFYNQYITLDFLSDDGTLIITLDGEYPSIRDTAYTEPFALEGGETVIHAIRVAKNGLVSPLTVVSFTIGGVIEEAKLEDPAMELALREQLGIVPEEPLMTNQLWEVTEFTIPADAASLVDLKYLPRLEKLTIPERKLDSLSVLSNLSFLRELDLSGCRFPAADLQVLSTLQDLTKLNISNCGLSTIANLSGAIRLTSLDLSGNTLRNLEPLAQMSSLQELYLQHNAVTSLDQLSSLSALSKLDISYNSVTDLTPLASCAGLSWLNAGHNQISTLEGMSTFTALTHLYLDHNALLTVNPLRSLTNIQVLDVSYNKLQDVDATAALVNLMEMYCSNNELVHLPLWPESTPLSTLDISHNQIGTLEPVAKLDSLTYVYCDYNWLNSLDPIANCYRLVMVNAYGNEIKDVSKLTAHNIIVNYDPTN